MAHRYWRVLALTSNGNPVSCSELELHDTIGGPQLCVGGTPISNGDYGGSYDKSYAFDGNRTDGHEWASNISDGAWIGYDFGAGNEKAIVEFSYTARQNYGSQTPNLTALQYSDNGSDWSTLFTVPLGTWNNGETKVRSAPPAPAPGANPHLYWRVRHDAYLDYICAREIELRGTPGGVDLTNDYLANAFDPGHYSNWSAARAFDGDLGTNYGQNGAGFVGAQFSYPVTIDEVAWNNRSDGGNNYQIPHTGSVDYSDNGNDWVTAWTFEFPTTWAPGETKIVTNPNAGTAPASRRRQAIIVT